MRLRAIFNLVFATLALTAACALPASAADNYTVKDSLGATKTICSKDVGGVHSTCNVIKKADGSTLINPSTEEKQDTGNASLSSIDSKLLLPVAGTAVTTITRPADTTAYAANDAWADSTSAPTSGGFTLSNVCAAAGKGTLITSLVVVSSNDPASLLVGEVWLFDSAVTAVNDNAAMNALSDSDALKLVAVIPFGLQSTGDGTDLNSYYAVNGLGLRATCVGSANLRYLVKVRSAYTPASGETLTIRVAYDQVN